MKLKNEEKLAQLRNKLLQDTEKVPKSHTYTPLNRDLCVVLYRLYL